MIAAFKQAQNATLFGEVPVGCIIALNNEIISVGNNKCISKKVHRDLSGYSHPTPILLNMLNRIEVLTSPTETLNR